jgi:hypothetical protein
MVNQKWTNQRPRQHREHKKQDENTIKKHTKKTKTNKKKTKTKTKSKTKQNNKAK